MNMSVYTALGGAQRLFSLKQIYARNGNLPPAIGSNNELFVTFHAAISGDGKSKQQTLLMLSFLIFYGRFIGC
jgi:hypothetical protein